MSGIFPLTVREQDIAMRRDWSAFRTVRIDEKRETVAWRGRLKPGINEYTVTIEYSMDWVLRGPKVRVVDPVLARLPGNPEGSLPHVYNRSADPYLCLFDPRRGEWSGWKAISQTIVPWTIDWLACYEDWLFTGVWHGGGAHVGSPTTIDFNLETSA